MQGGGELTLCPWGGYGRGPFRTSDGRYYCLDHKTGSTFWLSLEPPAHLQAEAARLAGKRRPWDKKPADADADADAKRPKLNTEGGGEEGAYNHLAFEMPASTSVRVGDSFQARVPGFSPRAARAAEHDDRGDELLDIEFSPLTAPPKQRLPPEPLAAAAAAASADAQAADAAAQAAADEEEARLREELEEDPEDALAKKGLEVGDVCLAWGLNAGTRRQFKALLVTTRTTFPPLLVRYLGDERGVRNPLLMPDVPTAHLRTSEVTRYREPPPKEEEAEGQGGGSGGEDGAEAGGACVQRKSLRERSSKKPSFVSALATEAQGIQLHLDPRCTLPGYSGTGYKGVMDDYWPSGFKRDKPYTVQHDGRYQGRFALVIEAALHYAKLELGIAPSRDELKEEERRQKEEQKKVLQQDRLLGEDGIRGGGLQNAKQNVCPPKRRAKPKPRAAALPPPPRAAAAPPRTRG